jgi:hypothetical protein
VGSLVCGVSLKKKKKRKRKYNSSNRRK